MQNPEKSRYLSTQVLYRYQTHRNIPWNIVEYQPVREYADPILQITERKYNDQEKGQQDSRYKTKKGFYMDYHLKVVSALPSPSHYNLKDSFNQQKNQKRGKFNKLDLSLTKYTYLDRIQMEQKNKKKPAPGDYNLTKTDHQIKEQLKALKSKKRSVGEKAFFYQQFEHLSNSVPGTGSYNPHLQVPHVRQDIRDHKFWINKHNKISHSFHKKRLSEPDPGSYSPCPLDVTTFDRIKTAELINKRRNNLKKTGFGTDAKFPYDRPSKIIIKEQRPQPTAYNTGIEWKGKNMQTRANNWVRSVSTGFTKSIYNS